jgi:hypothetical protein
MMSFVIEMKGASRFKTTRNRFYKRDKSGSILINKVCHPN